MVCLYHMSTLLMVLVFFGIMVALLASEKREPYLQSGKALWTSEMMWQKRYRKLKNKKGKKYQRRAEALKALWTPITLPPKN